MRYRRKSDFAHRCPFIFVSLIFFLLGKVLRVVNVEAHHVVHVFGRQTQQERSKDTN